MHYSRTIIATTALVALGAAFAPAIASAQDATSTHPIPALLRERALASSTAAELRNDINMRRMMASTTAAGMRAGMRGMGSTTAATRMDMGNKALMNAMDRADQEIDRRIKALEAFVARIGNVHISDTDKGSLTATMQSQIDNLSILKGDIDNDTSTSTLKTAIQSITTSYRIFALVIPQSAITAAADRVTQIVSQMQELSTKLMTRITAASTAGNDTSALAVALTDLNMKVADATSQSQAAVTEVNGLAPDNGDQTIAQSNKTALQDADTKIKTAEQDLQAAREDAETIVKGLMAFGDSTTGTASTTPVTSTTTTP